MRRFRFPLARLQRLRAHEERAARRQLASAATRARELHGRLATAAANVAVCEDERGAASPLARALAAGYRRLRSSLAVHARDADARLERAQERYRERRRELEGLVRLRARRREAWLAAAEHETRAELDELALRRFADAQRAAAEEELS